MKYLLLLFFFFYIFISGMARMFSNDYEKKHIDSIIKFYNHQFDTVANFHATHFNKKAEFQLSKFTSEALFDEAIFNSLADFGGVQFDSLASFWSADFNSKAWFHGTSFVSDADFSYLNFKSHVRFNSAHFKQGAIFEFTNFLCNTVDFSSANFYSKTNFWKITLPDTLFFHNVNTEKEIDLSNCILNPTKKTCYISLKHTDINKIKIDYTMFQLMFYPYDNYKDTTHIYEKLLLKAKKDGFIESYEKLDIEYREIRYKHKKQIFINWLQKNWWNYGYNKELIFRNSIILFFFFMIINFFIFGYLNRQVYVIENIWNPYLGKRNNENFFFSINSKKPFGIRNYLFGVSKKIVLILFYTLFVFFGVKLSTERMKFHSLPGVIYLFIQYLTGLICLGYILNFIITK